MVHYIFEARKFKYTALFVWNDLVWFVGNPEFTETTDDNSGNSDNDNNPQNGDATQPDNNTPNGSTTQPDGGTTQPDGGASNGGTTQPDNGAQNGGTGQQNNNGSNGNDPATQTPNDNSDNPVKFNRPANSVVNGIPTDSEGKYDFSSFYPDLSKIDKKNMATYGSVAINPEKKENQSLLYGVDNNYDGRPKIFKK